VRFGCVNEDIWGESLEAVVPLLVIIIDVLDRHESLRMRERIFRLDLFWKMNWIFLEHAVRVPYVLVAPQAKEITRGVGGPSSPRHTLGISFRRDFYYEVVRCASVHNVVAFYLFLGKNDKS
jgi:hypothetical protein